MKSATGRCQYSGRCSSAIPGGTSPKTWMRKVTTSATNPIFVPTSSQAAYSRCSGDA